MTFDYAILGGGAAGLSLALELVHSSLSGRSILIVEKDAKNTNDRTWCFWPDVPNPLDGIVFHTWPNLRIRGENFDRTFEIHPFRYVMVRGLDFYNYARGELMQHNVTIVRGVGEVQDGKDAARIRVEGKEYEAAWAFDSRLRTTDIVQAPLRYNYLIQHFKGWEIQTESAVFDPHTATLFDLYTPQRGGVTFFYVLPFSARYALVEYTVFSQEVLPDGDYDQALQDYLHRELGLVDYRILKEERGVIPMTDHPFPRRLGERILAIGTRGGRVKPSTGYAFARIQRDSRRIVDSLVRHSHPFAIRPDPRRYRFYDALLLEVLKGDPFAGRRVLSAIFARNPVQRVLRFLDDGSSLGDDLLIISSCPLWPFLEALGREVKKRGSLH